MQKTSERKSRNNVSAKKNGSDSRPKSSVTQPPRSGTGRKLKDKEEEFRYSLVELILDFLTTKFRYGIIEVNYHFCSNKKTECSTGREDSCVSERGRRDHGISNRYECMSLVMMTIIIFHY